MGSLDKIAKAGVFVFLGMGFERFFGYLFRLAVARLGVEIYGLYSIGFSVVTILVSISMLGLAEGVIRFVSFHAGRDDKEKANKVVSSAVKAILPASLVFAVLLFLLSDTLAAVFHEPELSSVLKIFSPIIPLWALLNLYSAVNTAYKKIEYVVLAEKMIAQASKIVFLLVFIHLGLNLAGVILAPVFASLMALACLAYCTRKYLSIRIVKGFDAELFSFSWPVMLMMFALIFIGRMDTLLIAYLKDTVDVAAYNTAYPTATLLFISSSALSIILLPTITEKYARKESMESDYKTVSRWIFLMNLPLAALMVFYSRDILRILFGAEYVQASLSLSLLGLTFFLDSFARPSGIVLMTYKKTRFLLYITLIQITLNLTLGFILIPAFGITGAALATSIGYLFRIIIVYLAVYHLTKARLFDYTYLKPILSVAVSGGILYLITHNVLAPTPPAIQILPSFAVYFSIYMLLLFASNALTENDKKVLKTLKENATSVNALLPD